MSEIIEQIVILFYFISIGVLLRFIYNIFKEIKEGFIKYLLLLLVLSIVFIFEYLSYNKIKEYSVHTYMFFFSIMGFLLCGNEKGKKI